MTSAQAEEIRARYATGEVTQQALGDEFGISQVRVGQIIRRSWLPVPRPTIEEKFWAKVNRRGPDDCWEAQTYRPHGLHATFYAGRPTYAHRVVWELTNGPIPLGLEVMHTCDNPPCVNPAHLVLGTHADNMADMARKGRAATRANGRHRSVQGAF